MSSHLELQRIEVNMGNEQTVNSFHCFSFQLLLQVQLPCNFMSSVSLPSSTDEQVLQDWRDGVFCYLAAVPRGICNVLMFRPKD